jgi:2-dehydropantoate 2-reductase
VPKFSGETVERWADSMQRETWEALDAMLTQKATTARNWRASMAQDIVKGRPTEIDYMNGHVVAQGQIVGVPTPVSEATVGMIKEIEAGERKPSPGNIAEVLKRAGV